MEMETHGFADRTVGVGEEVAAGVEPGYRDEARQVKKANMLGAERRHKRLKREVGHMHRCQGLFKNN